METGVTKTLFQIKLLFCFVIYLQVWISIKLACLRVCLQFLPLSVSTGLRQIIFMSTSFLGYLCSLLALLLHFTDCLSHFLPITTSLLRNPDLGHLPIVTPTTVSSPQLIHASGIKYTDFKGFKPVCSNKKCSIKFSVTC